MGTGLGLSFASYAHAQAIEEIVVTAEKREQRLIDIGATVSALSSRRIQEARVQQITDVLPQVSNGDIKQQFAGMMPVVTLRGVGLDDVSSTSNPGVGVYVDEVPLATLTLMTSDYFDLNRIEVLKGPQGTLYGRNTTGGAINIISQRPTDKLEGSVTLGYGNYETFTAEGMINVPVSDKLRIRIAAKTIQQDEGFAKSDRVPTQGTPLLLLAPTFSGAPGSRDIGERHPIMGRALFDFEPTDRLSVLLKLEVQHSRAQTVPPKGQPSVAVPPVLSPFTDPNPDPDRGNWGENYPLNVDSHDAMLRIGYDLGFGNLTSVTGYYDLRRFFQLDGDGTGYAAYTPSQHDRIKQLTEELRLDGKGKVVDWIVGVFGSYDHVSLDTHTDLSQFAAVLAGVPLALTNDGFANQETYNGALFANGTWHLLPELDLVTGIRGTYEERHFQGFTHWGPQPFASLFGLTDADSANVTDDGVISPGINPGGHLKTTTSNVSHKIALNWKVAHNTLVYASEALSWKSGGFFSETTTNSSFYIPYKAERLQAWEVGAKWQGPQLSVNGALFYYNYANMQMFATNPSVPIQNIVNVPRANIYGLDFDATWLPIDGLTLQGSIGLLRSHLDSFPLLGLPNAPAGNQATNAPKFTATSLVRYEFDILSGWRAAVQGSVRYQSHSWRDATNSPGIDSPPYLDVDARVSFFDVAKAWELAFWGKNLGDERHRVNAVEARSLGILPVYYNTPRTFGVELTHHFE